MAVLTALALAAAALGWSRASVLDGRLETAEDDLAKAEVAAKVATEENDKCVLLNAANAKEAMLQRERAREAANKVRELERSADERAREVDDEADTLRASNLTCPAINADYRRWMLDRSP